MALKPRILLLFLLPVFSASAFAQAPSTCLRTFFIDFATGSDGNNGTSKTTPWKHAPGMQGFSAAYSHSAGDCFIFKGGVTWPNAALQLQITNSGTAATPDYYGVDMSYFSGTSFSRPIFDAQGLPVTGPIDCPIYLLNVSSVIVDNIELRNQFISTATGTFNRAGINVQTSSNVTVKNCFLHDWTIASGTTDDKFGGISVNPPDLSTINGNMVLGNTVGPGPNLGISAIGNQLGAGEGIEGASLCQSNTVHHVPNGILGCINFIGNTVHDIVQSVSDPSTHENGMYVFRRKAPQQVRNNVIFNDCCGTALYLAPGIGDKTETNPRIFAYNNVVWSAGETAPPNPFILDWEETNCAVTLSLFLFNNTAQCNAGACTRTVPRTCPITNVTIQNTHYITDSSNPECINQPGCGTVTNLTSANATLMTNATATAQGYTVSDQFAPKASTGATVNSGVNMTTTFAADGLVTSDIQGRARPATSAWNTGAYQFTLPNPPANLRLGP